MNNATPLYPIVQTNQVRSSLTLLEIPIDNLSMAETIDRIDTLVMEGHLTGKGHQVATANVDFLVKAKSDPELRAILQNADLVTADGMPLVWGSRLLGFPLKERVAGSDFIPLLATRSARKGYSIFLLGAAPEVAVKAAKIMVEANPGLKIAGVISPPVMPIEKLDPSIIVGIKAAQPDILLVAFGNPKQDKWIARHINELRVPVMIGIGGTLDFIAGNTKRAPIWMQKAGLEWVYRLIREPRRLFKRYVVDLFVFNTSFFMQWISLKLIESRKIAKH